MPSPKNLDANSLAVVYDWMTAYGGSERLIAEILRIYPQAKLHALLHHAPAFENTPLANQLVRTSFLQSLPAVHRYYRSLLPLMPFAIETMNADDHGVVLSVSHAVAHAIRTDTSQMHVSYICTPIRYAWHLRDDYLHLHGLDRPAKVSPSRGSQMNFGPSVIARGVISRDDPHRMNKTSREMSELNRRKSVKSL